MWKNARLYLMAIGRSPTWVHLTVPTALGGRNKKQLLRSITRQTCARTILTWTRCRSSSFASAHKSAIAGHHTAAQALAHLIYMNSGQPPLVLHNDSVQPVLPCCTVKCSSRNRKNARTRGASVLPCGYNTYIISCAAGG